MSFGELFVVQMSPAPVALFWSEAKTLSVVGLLFNFEAK